MLEQRGAAGVWTTAKRHRAGRDRRVHGQAESPRPRPTGSRRPGLAGPAVTVRVARVSRARRARRRRGRGRASSSGQRSTAGTSAPGEPRPGAAGPSPTTTAARRDEPVRYWSPRRRSRRLAFAPTDPLATRQWYAVANRAYDAWQTLPPLAPVRVAVIDSGVDLGHPDLAAPDRAREELRRRLRAGHAGPRDDRRGHHRGGARQRDRASPASRRPRSCSSPRSSAPPARSRSRPRRRRSAGPSTTARASSTSPSAGSATRATPAATRTRGSRRRPSRYAVRRGAVIVAAVGNGDQAPSTPWNFASYPAALPHVLGVSALARSGALAGLLEPRRGLQRRRRAGRGHHLDLPAVGDRGAAGCAEQGYTPCATDDFRPPEGTSFAAPQVTAVAANLLGVRPQLTAEQVVAIIERTAADASAATGLPRLRASAATG